MTTNWTDSQKKLIETVAKAMQVDDILKVSRQQRYIDSRMMLFKYLKDIDGYNCTEISRMEVWLHLFAVSRQSFSIGW